MFHNMKTLTWSSALLRRSVTSAAPLDRRSVKIHVPPWMTTSVPARRSLCSQPGEDVRVLYDGLCPICVTEIRFLQFLQKNRAVKVDFVDISLPDYDETKYKNISYEAAMKEMHVINEKDEVQVGVPAFAVMYTAVGLGWMARLMMWPPVRPLMDKSYAVFARNRLKWTGRPEKCNTEQCEKRTQ